MLQTYRGSCHCQAAKFEAYLDLMYGVNIGCLDGVSEEALSKMPITCVDGLHDPWQNAPDFFAHL